LRCLIVDELSSCTVTSLNTYALVTSFLVRRRSFWVSRILRLSHLRLCWRPLKVDPYDSDAYNAIVTLDGAKGIWSVESLLKLPEGTQPQNSLGELLECEDIIKNDARVQALAKEVGKLDLHSLIVRLVTYSHHLQALSHTRSLPTDGQ
jgi:hypothetical protein